MFNLSLAYFSQILVFFSPFFFPFSHFFSFFLTMNVTNDHHKHDHLSTPTVDLKSPLLPINLNDLNQEVSPSLILSLATPNTLFVFLGPLLCGLICLFVKVGELDSSRNMLGILTWIFTWWLTEAVPMPVTSMSPLFLFPMFGIASADVVAKSYMDDVISLVLGSFILALAVEHYNIHKRLALNVSPKLFFLSLYIYLFSLWV